MVNRCPAAGGQVPKQMQKKLSFMPYDLLVGVCLSKWRDWIFFLSFRFFSAPELQLAAVLKALGYP